MKCVIQHDLLFWEPAPSSILKAEFNDDGEDDKNGDDDREEFGTTESWDNYLTFN